MTPILDQHGLVRGGLRTPWVDVPTAVITGMTTAPGFARMFGVTRPFPADKLAELYPGGRDEYLERFTAAAEQARAGGFLLDEDVQEAIELAKAAWARPSGRAGGRPPTSLPQPLP